MKKAKFYLIFYGAVCVIAAAGMLLGMITYRISEAHPDYLSISFGQGVIVFLVSIWISSLLHETAHAIAFKCCKQKLRMFYIFPLCFIKEGNRIKKHITANWLIGLGGIVVPGLKAPQNSDEMNRDKQSLRVSLLCGPLFSTVLGVISLLVAIFATDYVNAEYSSWFFVFFAANFLVAIYINISSFFLFGGVIGDYSAYKLLNRNKAYMLLQLYNYYVIQNNDVKKEFREKGSYFLEEMSSYLAECLQQKEIDSEMCSLLDAVLYEELLRKSDDAIKTHIPLGQVMSRIASLEQRLRFEVYYKCFCHLIMFLHRNGEEEVAFDWWSKNKDKIPSTKAGKYAVAQVEMALSGVENGYLFQKKNMATASVDCILAHMENYFDDELELNRIILEERE